MQDLIEAVESSKAYESWSNENQGILVHLFSMSDSVDKLDNLSSWQVGFLNDGSRNITTFFMGDEVKLGPTSEAADPDASLEPLDISRATHDFTRVVGESLKLAHNPKLSKIIVLLRGALPDPEWVITIFTEDYKILSFMFDSATMELKSSSENSIKDLFRQVSENEDTDTDKETQ